MVSYPADVTGEITKDTEIKYEGSQSLNDLFF